MFKYAERTWACAYQDLGAFGDEEIDCGHSQSGTGASDDKGLSLDLHLVYRRSDIRNDRLVANALHHFKIVLVRRSLILSAI